MSLLYKILIIAYSVTLFSEGIITPIYAVFVQNIGGSLLDASRAVAIFLVTQGILTLLIHRRKHSRQTQMIMLIVGRGLWTCGICTYLMVSNVATLFIAQFLMGLGNAFCEPLFDQELAKQTDKDIQEYERSVFESSKTIIEGISGVIGACIATYLGFDRVIIIMAIAANISFVGILYYIYQKNQLNHI